MNEPLLYALAIYDDESQEKIERWRSHMISKGFLGSQTKNIPHHITLCNLPLSMRDEVMEMLERARQLPSLDLPVTKTATFADRVLFLEPGPCSELKRLKEVFGTDPNWHPHTTMFLSDDGGAMKAKEVLDADFTPFTAMITAVELYEFFPSRFLGRVELEGNVCLL